MPHECHLCCKYLRRKTRGAAPGKPVLVDIEQMRENPRSRNLKAEKIIGASKISGQLVFFVKWKGNHGADFVLAKQANIAFPQIVIKYYEERLSWTLPPQPANPTTDPTTNPPTETPDKKNP